MRYVEVTLPETLEYIDLWCVSDIHRGHRLHDERAWHALLDRVRDDPHAYMVLNGDLVEAALKSSRHGDVYRSMAPGKERRILVKELEPVRHKILAVTSGNHEARHRDSDEDPAELICDKIGILDRYDRTAVVLEVSFGRKAGQRGVPTSYIFYITHGQGNGRRPGAASTACRNWPGSSRAWTATSWGMCTTPWFEWSTVTSQTRGIEASVSGPWLRDRGVAPPLRGLRGGKDADSERQHLPRVAPPPEAPGRQA